MSVVCSRCSNIYDTATACPRCGAPSPVADMDQAIGHGPRWQQTVWGRILIGLILAQGLFYGLRNLLTGIVLAVSGEEESAARHMLLLQSIQIFGVFVGGMLAGGGQRTGLVLGALVGVWNGILAIAFTQIPYSDPINIYVHPLLHAAVGAIAGLLGSVIWKPIPASAVPVILGTQRKIAPRPKKPLFAGKIAWFRVIMGTAFSVTGTLAATWIFRKVVDISGGKGPKLYEFEDWVFTWEIRALAVLAGAALAGATTTNGLKQGLCVGIWASVLLIGIESSAVKNVMELSILTVISTMSLSLVGGWFGGQLFPPIVKFKYRRSLDTLA